MHIYHCISIIFQILDKKNIAGIFGSKDILAFCVEHFANLTIFSSNSDHSTCIQKQTKTPEHLILYTICNMKSALWAFDQK